MMSGAVRMQIAFGRVRRKTAPTGSAGNIKLPKYFLKPHETPPAAVGKYLKCLNVTDTHQRSHRHPLRDLRVLMREKQ